MLPEERTTPSTVQETVVVKNGEEHNVGSEDVSTEQEQFEGTGWRIPPRGEGSVSSVDHQ